MNDLKHIPSLIYEIRGCKVMLDSDLARLYEIETGALNRAVKRNIERFPEFFMFQLTEDELDSLRCQIGISKEGKGGRRYLPFVFTEHGVLMLSSVLNSKKAMKNRAASHAVLLWRGNLFNWRGPCQVTKALCFQQQVVN